MFLGIYAFEGEPAALLAAYERLIGDFPQGNLLLHTCVKRAGGIDVYDACPNREAFDGFAASAEFRGALEGAGLPTPAVTRLGDVHAAFAQGRRLA